MNYLFNGTLSSSIFLCMMTDCLSDWLIHICLSMVMMPPRR